MLIQLFVLPSMLALSKKGLLSKIYDKLKQLEYDDKLGSIKHSSLIAELKAKMADGFAASKQLFNMWYNATDKMQSQSNTVWSANKELTNVRYEHNIWSQADMAAQSYKKGNLSALDGFSDTRFGSPITDVGDTFQITNRENNISNRTYQLSESLTDKQAYYDEQQAILAQNSKERAKIDSDLELQIWRNKMTADEQDYYTKLMAQLTLYKNQQDLG